MKFLFLCVIMKIFTYLLPLKFKNISLQISYIDNNKMIP